MSESIELRINGTGILKLDMNCEANTNDGTILIPKRKIVSKTYKDFIPQLNDSIISEFQLSIPKSIPKDLLVTINTNKVKNNLIQLIKNSKSLNELDTRINEEISDDKIQMPIHYFYIIIVIAVISMGLLIVVNLYIKFKSKCSKIKNPIENTLVNKNEDVNTPNRESPLPGIV